MKTLFRMKNLLPITISTRDRLALSLKLAQVLPLDHRKESNLQRLRNEVERATVLPPELIPSTTVQLGSKFTVKYLDNEDEDTYILAWPERGDISQGLLSIFTPLGTAVLGFSQGDEIAWEMPGGLRRLKLVGVQLPASTGVPVKSG